MTEFTGLPMPSIAFDCDGVLTDQGTTTIGEDTDRKWDVTPLRTAISRGFSVGVMTCNVVTYVAAQLKEQGIRCYADVTMEYKTWDGGLDGCTVIVTNRKLLADRYVDDHGMGWSFGDDPELIFAGLPFSYDYRTVEYRRYAVLHLLSVRNQVSPSVEAAAMNAAQIAAGGLADPMRSYP